MLLGFVRNRTSTIVVMYSLYLYFLGLSLRNTSKALDIFDDEKRSHISVWNWIQRFGSSQIYKRKRVSAFIIDETIIQIGNSRFWLWIFIEPAHKSVLGIYISKERNMFVAERILLDPLLKNMVDIQFTQMVEHGIHRHATFYI
jgi:putative transposase